MSDPAPVLVIDNLHFEIRRSSRRQTIGITVDRPGNLIVNAPESASLADIEAIARDRRLWVHTKLAEKELLAQPHHPREYVAGEGFHYLGRSYRLKLVDPDKAVAPLRLYQGRFELHRDKADSGKDHYIRWYRQHAQQWLLERSERWTTRVDAAPSGLAVRDLGNRWGSCTAEGRVNFHWRTILLPAPMIDYVIVHELVHLSERQHTTAFWHRLEQAMPDYEQRKGWLAKHGARFDL